MQKNVQQLIDQVLEMARESLRDRDIALYETLTEFAGRLSVSPAPGTEKRHSHGNQAGQSRLYQIFSDFRGQECKAELDASKIIGTKPACVFAEGSWKTASRAAMDLFPDLKAINGWRWWEYSRDDGSTGFIDEIREQRNGARVKR